MKNINTYIIVLLFCTFLSAVSARVFDSPYDGIDWQNIERHRANLHTHTTESDGDMTLPDVVDLYKNAGYTMLTFTDHDTVKTTDTTWPWTDYGADPEALGMLTFEGNEISRTHHMGSYFNDYGSNTEYNTEIAIQEIGNRGGQAVMFHPRSYTWHPLQYVDLYASYSHLTGMEVYNLRDGAPYHSLPSDRALWDVILTELMPYRPVWGHSNDDFHRLSQFRFSWSIFLLDETSEAALNDAMANGSFYMVHCPDGIDVVPVLNSVTLNQNKDALTIDAQSYTQIVWIADGQEFATGVSVDMADVPVNAKYVRARIEGDYGLILTQPFGVVSNSPCFYPPFGTQPTIVMAFEGQTAILTAIAGAPQNYGDNITYQWYKGQVGDVSEPVLDAAGYISGSQTTTLEIITQESDEGDYWCRATNDGGYTDSRHASLVLQGMLGHYKLDGSADSALVDAPDGTTFGNPQWTQGIDGSAMQVQDGSGWVQVGTGEEFSFADSIDFTVSVWVKTDSFSNNGAIITNKNWVSGSNVGWVIAGRTQTGSWQWNYRGALGGRLDYQPTSHALADNQWHMLTVTHDRDGFATFYFDATKQDTMDISVSPGSIDTGYPIILGTDARAYIDGQMPPHWFDGAIDDVRIYNYALSDVEIAELYVDFNPEHKLCLEPLQGDLTGDCVVGLDDFAIFAAVWLECNLIPDCY